jgi:hypothetical protein
VFGTEIRLRVRALYVVALERIDRLDRALAYLDSLHTDDAHLVAQLNLLRMRILIRAHRYEEAVRVMEDAVESGSSTPADVAYAKQLRPEDTDAWEHIARSIHTGFDIDSAN